MISPDPYRARPIAIVSSAFIINSERPPGKWPSARCGIQMPIGCAHRTANIIYNNQEPAENVTVRATSNTSFAGALFLGALSQHTHTHAHEYNRN